LAPLHRRRKNKPGRKENLYKWLRDAATPRTAGDVEIGIIDMVTIANTITTDIAGEVTTVAYIATKQCALVQNAAYAAFFISLIMRKSLPHTLPPRTLIALSCAK
jgi:hypothetical protein